MNKSNVGLVIGVVAGVALFAYGLYGRAVLEIDSITDLNNGFAEIQEEYKKNNLTLRAAQQRYEMLLADLKANIRSRTSTPVEIEERLNRIAEVHRNILEIMSHT
ncbi:hypothetical protein D3C87_1863890 [compost metagenome]